MGQKSLCFYNHENNPVFKKTLTSLPLKEKVIIDKSIELFNDSEPCIIHRTFVIKKLLFEINQCLSHTPKNSANRIPLEQIPECIHVMWDIPYDIAEVEVIG